MWRFLGDHPSTPPPHSRGTLDHLNPLLLPPAKVAVMLLSLLDLQWARRLLAAAPSHLDQLTAGVPCLLEQVTALALPVAPTIHHQARTQYHLVDLGFVLLFHHLFLLLADPSQNLVICWRLLLTPDWAQYHKGQALQVTHWLTLRC